MNAPADMDGSRERGNSSRPRVLRVYSTGVMNGPREQRHSSESPDPGALSEMLGQGMIAFTEEKDIKAAWLSILSNYKKSDRIVIKPNFNNVHQGSSHSITSPSLINAVVKQLVELVGVPPGNISIYDLCQKIPHTLVRDRIQYPVVYVERMDVRTFIDKVKLRMHYGPASADTTAKIVMRERIVDEEGNVVTCYVPKVVTRADHVINMPLLTNHTYILNSGALKNHYGTVRFSNYNSYPGVLHGAVLNRSVTDINRNHHIQGKTRLIIADGLFGIFGRGNRRGEQTWKTFDNSYPSSIFLSRDSVAVDSVMACIVARERESRGLALLSEEYLEDAACQGLGVHEFRKEGKAFSRIQYEELSV